MSRHKEVRKTKAKEKIKVDRQNAFEKGQKSAFERETDGKLSPAEAEAIMSSDLPSGDPELSAPADVADKSPDFSRTKIDKAA